MNKMGKLFLSALSVVSFAACAVGSTDEAVVLGESQDALTGPNGKGFFGSDTMFNVMTDAITAAGLNANLTYLGTGSGNGEKCLRGTGPVPGGYCNGTIGQHMAPMSRPLNNIQPGEINNAVALDAIVLVTKSTQAADNASFDPPPVAPPPVSYVLGAFCGDGSGSAASCANFDTWGEFMAGTAIPPWSNPSNPGNAITLYRRDDASGTTDAFKAITGCTNFCSNVKIVNDDLVAGCRLSTDASGTSSLVANPPTASAPCSAGDSCTVCLGKLAANDVDFLAYAGREVLSVPGTKALRVNGVEPSEANIRSRAYPLTRSLYINEGTGSASVAELAFLDWAYNQDPQTFEDILVNHGFIACTDPTAPGHVALDCP